jgi:hypothetical protein
MTIAKMHRRQASHLQDPSGFVLDLQVYSLMANVCSHLGEHELARQYAELSKTARFQFRIGLEISFSRC